MALVHVRIVCGSICVGPTCLKAAWRPDRCTVTVTLVDCPVRRRAGSGNPYLYPSFFTSTSSFHQGFSFRSAESNSVFIHFLFSYLLFFTQAVGVTILSSSALHSSFLPHFPASLPYRFLTSSRHGKPHLARVLPSCRSHRECL